MKKAPLILGLAGLILTLSGTKAAFAGGAGSWQAGNAASAPYISRNWYSLWNNDTVNYRSVTSGFTNSYQGTTTTSVTIFGKNNGLTAICYLFGVNTATGTNTFTSQSTSVNGVYSMTLSLTPGGLDGWLFNVWCDLPRVNGTASYIYGGGF